LVAFIKTNIGIVRIWLGFTRYIMSIKYLANAHSIYYKRFSMNFRIDISKIRKWRRYIRVKYKAYLKVSVKHNLQRK